MRREAGFKPLLEVRYRFTVDPPHRSLYAPWFRRTPTGRLVSTDLHFDGDIGYARYVATAHGGDLQAFEEDLLAHPYPSAFRWEVEDRRDHVLLLTAEWREPAILGIPTSMKLTHDALGPEAFHTMSFHYGTSIHRALLPAGTPLEALWAALRETVASFERQVGVPVRLEVERVAPIRIPALASRPEREMVLTAYALGYYDARPAIAP